MCRYRFVDTYGYSIVLALGYVIPTAGVLIRGV